MKLQAALALAVAFFLGIVASWWSFMFCVEDSTCYLRIHEGAEALSGLVIPKVVMQTHYDLSAVPAKVTAQFDRHGHGFERVLFDDASASAFIAFHFSPEMALTFDAFSVGAHKADFFRYCYLFVNGGIYLDIKTQLVRPLQEIYDALMQQGSSMATCLTESHLPLRAWSPDRVYQGVIFARPRHPIFLECLEFMKAYGWRGKAQYHVFCQNFAQRLHARGVAALGAHPSQGWTLWSEKVWVRLRSRAGKKTKKWLASTIVDADTKEQLFVTRFADFPWAVPRS
jgi:hypothetical protein